MGLYSWSGSNIKMPETLSDTNTKKVVTPFADLYYFNVVTYGYSMLY